MVVYTPGGWPYPAGTEMVRDGDDAIHTLALALDNEPDECSAGRTADYTAATGVWGKHTWNINPVRVGTGITFTGAGPTATYAGRYWAQGFIYWSASNSPAGRRILGVAESGQSVPPNNQFSSYYMPANNICACVIGCPITLAAGQSATLFTYQDSGASIVVPAANIGITLFRLRK